MICSRSLLYLFACSTAWGLYLVQLKVSLHGNGFEGKGRRVGGVECIDIRSMSHAAPSCGWNLVTLRHRHCVSIVPNTEELETRFLFLFLL